MKEFEIIAGKIKAAKNPEDIFGGLDKMKDPIRSGRAIYRSLSRATHPDLHADPEAAGAFARLSVLWGEAEEKLKTGRYGVIEQVTETVTVKTRKKEYQVEGEGVQSGFAQIYTCSFLEGTAAPQKGIFKIVRDPGDNDLLENEARILNLLKNGESYKKHPKFFPDLADSFIYRDSANPTPCQANVFRKDEFSYYSLQEVKAAYPYGIDPKDAAWMWRRLLFSMGIAHQSNVLHGAVLPPHILVQPEHHGMVLQEWSYGVSHPSVSGEIITAVSPDYETWFPQEVFKKELPTPGLDIYLGAKTMVDLLGGDPMTGGLPDTIHPRIKAFFKGCLLSNPKQRPQDAWDLLGEFDQLIGTLWGPRKFHPFGMPKLASKSPFR